MSLNVSTFGTKFNISSVTLQPKIVYYFNYNIIEIILKEKIPFKLLTHFWSKFLSIESSFKSKSSGIVEFDNLANNMSNSIPSNSVLITGTNASSITYFYFNCCYLNL